MNFSSKLGMAALTACALVSASVSSADILSDAKQKPAATTSYDYALSKGEKQVRLTMATVNGERVYSTFTGGALLTSIKVPDAAAATLAASADYNAYVRKSAEALSAIGLDPSALGLSYVSLPAAQPTLANGKPNSALVEDALKTMDKPAQFTVTVTETKN